MGRRDGLGIDRIELGDGITDGARTKAAMAAAGASLKIFLGPYGLLVLISGWICRVAVTGRMVRAKRTATSMKPVPPPAAAMTIKGPPIAPSLATT